MIKIKLKETPEQIELIKALGSKDAKVSSEANQMFAQFAGPVVQKVLEVAGTSSMIYSDWPFQEDTNPVFPLDLYYGEDAGNISTWSQGIAGGLPTNQIEAGKDMKIATYRIDSAVSWKKKYARQSLLDVPGRALARMANEILIKQERNAWAVILSGLAAASTKGKQHLIRAGTSGTFLLDDLNNLLILFKRINAAYNTGTTDMANANGLTDIFISPEIKGQIRAFTYNPLNTRVGVAAGTSSAGYAATAVPLPDSIREEIFRSAGAQELYGVAIHDLNELGIGFLYNVLMGTFTSGNYSKLDGTGSASFTQTAEQVIVGIDASRDAFLRPVETQEGGGGTVQVLPDDQFTQRSDSIGQYSWVSEARILLDARAVCGLIT